VTGVSRRIGIGRAIAHRPLSDGVAVFARGFEPHDDEGGFRRWAQISVDR
jgi:hypothetical protein